ncbi:MAG: linear amide C-N hydrolase [Gammaproteobacteria bacterium]
MKRLTLLLMCAVAIPVWACTGIMHKAKDGVTVNGRTVEFAINLDIGGVVIPQGYAFKGTLPDGTTNGITYKAKYAVVGANAFGEKAIIDGMNEAGLTVGAFYFPGYAGYASITADNQSNALSSVEYPNWLLTQFATIDEVKQHFADAVIVPTEPKGWGLVPPFHYVVYDRTGKSVVIEPIKGKLVIYDNPLGVVTNSPTFDWHMTNLGNYTNLTPVGASPVEVDGVTLQAFGSGSGLHGLPGDFTPPSRFVRAAVFSATAVQADTGRDAVLEVFHLLNQFDIPKGSVRDKNGNAMLVEYTLATSVKDPTAMQYFLRTYEDQTIKVIDLNKFDKKAADIVFINVKSTQPIVDVKT